jgi:selenide,water dikinase
LALVQTVDVFTPNVDDPYVFGQIAAANSLSDIYAMGGRPLTALSIIGFPIERMSCDVMGRIMRGGIDKMQEAGVPVIGGHSISERDIKFGFAVTGMVDPSAMVVNSGAQAGDALVLTKPIGVGAITFAGQLGRASQSALGAISRCMRELNRVAAEGMVEMGANAATDVTGFGLLGHLGEMGCQSGVTIEVYADRVPVFEGALDYIRQGMISGATERNKEYASRQVSVAEDVSEELEYVLYDPQTSGGLLVSMPEERAGAFVALLRERGVRDAAIIGKVISNSEGRIMVKMGVEGKAARVASLARKEEGAAEAAGLSCCEPAAQEECCASAPEGGAEGKVARIRERFSDFMGEVGSEGAISLRNKELMAVALSVLSKCEPCVKVHVDKARALGVSEEEISEAVWMAVSFGGAPTLMFYNSMREKE